MNIQDIYELLDRFQRSGLSELDLEMEGSHVALKKPVMEHNQVQEGLWSENLEKEENKKEISTPDLAAEPVKEIKAPLAGVFYTAPSPEAAPFVKPGQKIHKGDVIGIIEAMKLMNELTAEEDGTIREVVAQDGQLTAFDEVLMRYV